MSDIEVTQADRDAVTVFHAAQIKRIMSGDKTLGKNRDCIEQAFARHRIAALEAQAARIAELERDAEIMSEALAEIAYTIPGEGASLHAHGTLKRLARPIPALQETGT